MSDLEPAQVIAGVVAAVGLIIARAVLRRQRDRQLREFLEEVERRHRERLAEEGEGEAPQGKK